MQLFSRLKRALISTLSLLVLPKRKIRRSCSGAPECTQMCEECRLTSAERSPRCMMRKRRIRRCILISALILLLISCCLIPLSSDELLSVWLQLVELISLQ